MGNQFGGTRNHVLSPNRDIVNPALTGKGIVNMDAAMKPFIVCFTTITPDKSMCRMIIAGFFQGWITPIPWGEGF
jgi:hypothetical protein